MARPRSLSPAQETTVRRRKRRGWTLKRLAARYGVSAQTIVMTLNPKARARHNAYNRAYQRRRARAARVQRRSRRR